MFVGPNWPEHFSVARDGKEEKWDFPGGMFESKKKNSSWRINEKYVLGRDLGLSDKVSSVKQEKEIS